MNETDIPQIARATVLSGHTSPETGYLIEDYPYGRLRCMMRVWIDGPPEKGAQRGQYRIATQTTNPKVDGVGAPTNRWPYGDGPDGHPWNKPHYGTYTHWLVLYRDEANGHIEHHGGSFDYGLTGPYATRMKLDGTYGQLTEGDRKLFDVMAKIGHAANGWDHWDRAVALIREHLAAGGPPASLEQLREAHLIVHQEDYPVAVLEAERRIAEANSVKMATPAEVGVWIEGDDDHNGARLVLIARDRGWDGKAGDGQPEADVFTLAERELAGDDLTADEADDLNIRYPLHAETWMDENAIPRGYTAGWCNGLFFFQTVAWWENETANGRPDEMFL